MNRPMLSPLRISFPWESFFKRKPRKKIAGNTTIFFFRHSLMGILLGLGMIGMVDVSEGMAQDGMKQFWDRLNPFNARKTESVQTTSPAPARNGSNSYASEGWNAVGTSIAPSPIRQPAVSSEYPSPALTNTVPAQELVSPFADPTTTTEKKEPGKLPDPYPVEKNMFQLPFENLLSTRPLEQIQEVRLYASRDMGRTWNIYQTFPRQRLTENENKIFNVRTAKDGEYWFVVSLVDRQNGEYPRPDMGPTWRIIVNTSGNPLNSTMVHAEPDKTHVQGKEYPVWTPNSNDPQTAKRTSGHSAAPNSVAFSVSDATDIPENESSIPVYKINKPVPIETEKKENQSHQSSYPETTAENLLPQLDPELSENASLENFSDVDSVSPISENRSSTSDDLLLSLSAPANDGTVNATIRYMNKPRLSIDYDISTVGSSGVGKVELWGTLDGGQTWKFLTEDKDCVSPLLVDLPEDGEYGLTIVVLNGAGLGPQRPTTGTLPQMEVVLDRIPPQLKIESVRLMADFGELEIGWSAEDEHFGPTPILLSWSSAMEGPWRAMTTALENNGLYSWRIPDNLPGKIFVRMDAGDLSKNSTTLVTGPVVTDMVRPTAIIRDAQPVP